jgi:DNA-binding MarR family transcriptional regulator
MQFKKLQMSDEERTVLRMLARRGIMSPSRVSAETMILPGNLLKMLRNLADVGMVALRDDPDSADGQLVVLTAQGRDLLEQER